MLDDVDRLAVRSVASAEHRQDQQRDGDDQEFVRVKLLVHVIILAWCNWKPLKKKSRERIDGIVALIMAMEVASKRFESTGPLFVLEY